MKRISILVVTKNRSNYLNLCLTSLMNQSVRPWEVVVVDNASSDNTKDVVDSFIKKLPILYHHTQVHGYPKIYNVGIKAATGEWIVFFDDDCVAGSDWLSCLQRAIQKHPLAAIQGKTISIPKGNIYAEIMGDHYSNWIEANRTSAGTLRTFDNKNLCIPRYAMQKYGLFDESLLAGSEDIELGLRYVRHGIIIRYEPSIVAYHHERDTFQGFLQQHIRIARSEAVVDQKVLAKERLGMAMTRKTVLNLKSFFRREFLYLRRGAMVSFLKTQLLYLTLAAIRIWTYYMTTWSTRK